MILIVDVTYIFLILSRFFSVGSFAWKASWGPQYHQSMTIGICALVFSSSLAICEF